MWVWTSAFIFSSWVSILTGSVLTKASLSPTLHNRWLGSLTKNHLEDGGRKEKKEKEGRWIELTPVSSPLAATKEQMLTLGLTIASLLSRPIAHVTHFWKFKTTVQIPKQETNQKERDKHFLGMAASLTTHTNIYTILVTEKAHRCQWCGFAWWWGE